MTGFTEWVRFFIAQLVFGVNGRIGNWRMVRRHGTRSGTVGGNCRGRGSAVIAAHCGLRFDCPFAILEFQLVAHFQARGVRTFGLETNSGVGTVGPETYCFHVDVHRGKHTVVSFAKMFHYGLFNGF